MFLELISHRASASYTNSTGKDMTEPFLQRKEDREGGGREYEGKDYHKAMQTGNLTVLGIKYCYI